ncbi:VPLPA-CTERM sorting domain-containing protein [Parvularcula maris]|uniref:VPLPA-CTERM sorting domain-containing protein n=1 Tax=Parvularcula maris TaxID=2965077 RepID=A0A9X2L9S9_9PROT|nr:VPLPA-CTERM sorting domain-containing protein [Parvularcula maris]MCQ8185750.1 VPLPA-CTERM sorting domain-containing protein [Parvularcula maris]
MRKILAAAASVAVLAGVGAEAALLDLTKRDNDVVKTLTNDTVLSNLGFDTTMVDEVDVYNGVPNPQGDNPLILQVGQVLIRIEGFNDPVNGNEGFKGDCDGALDTGLTCGTGSNTAIDGIGIGDDEIDVQRSERVEITFHDGTTAGQGAAIAVNVTETFFLDLFFNVGFGDVDSAKAADRAESAVVTFETSTGTLSDEVFALMAKGTGSGFAQGPELLAALGDVTKIIFTSGSGDDDGTGDFALAGLNFNTGSNIENTVPVPAALPLFLAGLGGLTAFRRRQRTAK